jgi:hypothetical protein
VSGLHRVARGRGRVARGQGLTVGIKMREGIAFYLLCEKIKDR